MQAINKTLLALAFLSGSAAVQANEGSSNFAGITLGSTSDKIERSSGVSQNMNRPNANGVIGKNATWGLRVGQQAAESRYYATYDNVSSGHNGLKLRQENLLGSYDAFVPLGHGKDTNLFLGGTLGMTKLSQESRGVSRSTDMGYAYGGQAGVHHQVSQSTSMELGYRYLRSNASTRLSEHNGPKLGSLSLNSSSQAYLAANYHF